MLSWVEKIVSKVGPAYEAVRGYVTDLIRPTGPTPALEVEATATVLPAVPELDVFEVRDIWDRAGLDWATAREVTALGPNMLVPEDLWLPAEFNIQTDYWYRFEVKYVDVETGELHTQIMQMGSDRVLTKAQAESEYGEILDLYAEDYGMTEVSYGLVAVNYRS